MNIYCSGCGKELEIEKDMGTEIHVFPHDCTPQEPEEEYQDEDDTHAVFHYLDGDLV